MVDHALFSANLTTKGKRRGVVIITATQNSKRATNVRHNCNGDGRQCDGHVEPREECSLISKEHLRFHLHRHLSHLGIVRHLCWQPEELCPPRLRLPCCFCL